MAVAHVKELAVTIPEAERRSQLVKCAATAMSSKLIHQQKDFFANMVVDAVSTLDELMPLNMIGIKKVQGGSLEETQLIEGVAFKETFSYAGFEMQQKSYQNPKIALLNVELELKAEKDNAEVRVDNVEEYQKIVDAEWNILYDKLDKIHQSGAIVVLSKLPIGDVATQYFADRGIFCAGRVPEEDLNRTMKACGGSIQTTVNDLNDETLGFCEFFEEKQVGGERFNFFTGVPKTKTCTIILRGGAEQFMEETERSLHDAIMIVRRAIKNDAVVDATNILNKLRQKHAQGNNWYGVDIMAEDVADNFEACVWEPAIVKINAITAAAEAACLILSVDETVKNPRSGQGEGKMGGMPPMGRGRGRPMM